MTLSNSNRYILLNLCMDTLQLLQGSCVALEKCECRMRVTRFGVGWDGVRWRVRAANFL